MKKVLASLLMAFVFTAIVFGQNTINFNKQGYYPEGVAYFKAKKTFLVGSMTSGEIGAVDKNGNLTTFINDDALISPIGIKIDNENQLLYVANADIGVSSKTKKEGQGKTAEIIVFDLTTKKKTATYDLAALSGEGYFFANDLAYDDEGNIYVTNSFGPHIWKIDSKGKASVFATNELFNVEPNRFGLNGIVYHPDGYLIVSHYAKGALYKVPVNNPSNVSKVNINLTAIGADGLELVDENTLVVVANGSDNVKLNAAYTFKSANGWSSAVTSKINPLDDSFPTTTTVIGKKLYALYAHLDKMLSGADPATTNFKIVRVKY